MPNPNKRSGPDSEMEDTLAFPTWLDLPEPLLELLLERLPLVDYIRFAAVCPKWRSIQRGHRLRHAPHHPPMANSLPWLIPRRLNRHRGFQCYSPLDRKSYRLSITSRLHETRCLASCHGWLLLLDDSGCGRVPASKQPFLFNPITAAQIPLPLLLVIPWSHPIAAAMSTTPTDPDCVVLIVYGCRAFLYRPNDHNAANWTIIQLTSLSGMFGGSAIYCGGKFYCSYNSADKLYVIDPFLQEAASQLVMGYPNEVSTDSIRVSLLEISGELFSVQALYDTHDIKWFRLFKADLSRQKWVRVETLGDHVLFHHGACSVLLLAVDVSCKRNSIYASKEFRFPLGHDLFTLGVFDLAAGCWTEEDTLTVRFLGPWFLPTLDSTNLAKASD